MFALITLFLIEIIPVAIGIAVWNKQWKKTGILLIFIGRSLTLMQIFVAYDVYGNEKEIQCFNKAKELLNDNFTYYDEKGSDWERGIMATSWFAESLALQKDSLEAGKLLKNACKIVLLEQINTCDTIIQCKEGLYLAHSLIVLQSYKSFFRDTIYDYVSESYAERLAELIGKNFTHNAPSYGRMPDRWTGDNASMLHALFLYDKNNNTNIHKLLFKKWRETVDIRYTDLETQILLSEIKQSYFWSSYPRGSSIAYTVRYLSDLDEEYALSLWQKYKESYQINLGLIVLFREYPPNVGFADDYDSGMNFFGVGSSATGNSIAASAAINDDWTFWRLQNTRWGGYIFINLFPDYFQTSYVGNEANGYMANALYFWAQSHYSR